MNDKKYNYNYKRFTLLLDADEAEDQRVIAWLEAHKTRRNSYSDQMKNALLEVINVGQSPSKVANG